MILRTSTKHSSSRFYDSTQQGHIKSIQVIRRTLSPPKENVFFFSSDFWLGWFGGWKSQLHHLGLRGAQQTSARSNKEEANSRFTWRWWLGEPIHIFLPGSLGMIVGTMQQVLYVPLLNWWDLLVPWKVDGLHLESWEMLSLLGIGLKAQLKAGHVWQVQTQKKALPFYKKVPTIYFKCFPKTLAGISTCFNVYSTIIIRQVESFGAFESD